MIIQLTFNSKKYTAELSAPLSLALPLKQGDENPNCYWADPVRFETITAGNFIGSVKGGGSVNYQKVIFTPHGNGTHTECYGHISSDGATLNQNLNSFHFIGEVISVSPEKNEEGDAIITRGLLQEKIKKTGIEALIIRTLPNADEKKTRQYSGTNPPYLTESAVHYLVELGITHLLTDLPSIDREVDKGRLLAHRAFWKFPEDIRKNSTITELIFVDNSITDGLYLLNLQTTSLETDASPSKPVLYKLTEVS